MVKISFRKGKFKAVYSMSACSQMLSSLQAQNIFLGKGFALTFALAISCPRQGHTFTEVLLPTQHAGILVVPWCITDGACLSPNCDLHSPVVTPSSYRILYSWIETVDGC